MPKLIALVDKLPYGKIDHRKGDEFEADDRFANLVIAIGKARLAEPSPNASDLPREVMSRALKREPITEEPIQVEEVSDVYEAIDAERPVEKAMKAEEAVEEDEAPKPSPVMTYHRRDMVAEAPKAKPAAPPSKPLQPPKKRGRPSGKRS